jgi:hypothetical protein
VPWRDLVTLRPGERMRELLLPLPCLLLALLAAPYALWVLALAGSLYFFLTGLRLVHDVFHGNLGLRAWGNDVVLLVLSILMLGSMHAVRLTICSITASAWERAMSREARHGVAQEAPCSNGHPNAM